MTSINNAYPRGLTEDNLLTINYCDRYNYGYLQDSRLASILGTQTAWVRGLLTGSCVRQVGPAGAATGTSWLTSKNYYDAEYRLVQTLSLNHLAGVDNLITTYDFAGRAKNTQLTHTNFRNVTYTVANRFVYDNANRPALPTKARADKPRSFWPRAITTRWASWWTKSCTARTGRRQARR